MLASDLLSAVVVDADGDRVGRVCDVRFRRDGDSFLAVEVLVCESRFASTARGWGFGDGRAAGPWLLRKLLEPAARRARVVSADDVAEWSERTVRLRRTAEVHTQRERRQ